MPLKGHQKQHSNCFLGQIFVSLSIKNIFYEPVVRVVEANVDGEANVVQGEKGEEAQTDYPRDRLMDYLNYTSNG